MKLGCRESCSGAKNRTPLAILWHTASLPEVTWGQYRSSSATSWIRAVEYATSPATNRTSLVKPYTVFGLYSIWLNLAQPTITIALAALAGSVAAGDVTDNAQSAGDVMTSLRTDRQTDRQTSDEHIIATVRYVHSADIVKMLSSKRRLTRSQPVDFVGVYVAVAVCFRLLPEQKHFALGHLRHVRSTWPAWHVCQTYAQTHSKTHTTRHDI